MGNKITLYVTAICMAFVLAMHLKCPGQPAWFPQGAIQNTIAGESIPVFTAVYISSVDGKIYKADRNNPNKTAIGITIDTISANDTCQILRKGIIYNYPGGAYGDYYVGDNGILTTQKPAFGAVHRAAFGSGDLYIEFLERREAEDVTAYKTTDESRSSSDTLAGDRDLSITLDSGATYIIDIFAFVHNADSTMGYQYRTSYTGSYSGAQYRRTYSQAGWELNTAGIQAGDGTVPITTVDGVKVGTGFVQLSQTISTTSAGVYEFEWSQAVDSGNTITVRAGSHIKAKRIK